MFFDKKKPGRKCENCGSSTDKNHSFCPYCGYGLMDYEKEIKDFGLLGRADSFQDDLTEQDLPTDLGITDKLIGSIFNSMMKNLDKHFREMEKNFEGAEIKSFPNGVRIKISPGFSNVEGKKKEERKEKKISDEQMKKITSFPKEKAKTNVKRIGDKVVYELSTPGVISPEDVFVSKLESGYEIKAIGNKKIYVNSIPVNLPIRKYSIVNNKLFVEFF